MSPCGYYPPDNVPPAGISAGGVEPQWRAIMPVPAIRPDRLRSRLESLARIGADPAGGISRFPYSEAHAQAVRAAAAWMEEAGLQPGCDAFGNVIGLRPGLEGWPPILLGSHLDTVPHGGMFDGALGVLAGIEVAAALHEAGLRLRCGLAVIGFADEEGHQFGAGTLASRCLVGDLPCERCDSLRGRDGRTLAESMAAFAPGVPRAAALAQAGAYLELHIEQGPVLAREGRRAAAVTAITGIAKTRVVLEGQANHAGTTPMPARRDALAGAAEVVLAVRALAEAAGAPAVATVGTLAVWPGASNVVPGRAEFTVDHRAPDAGDLRRMCADIEEAVRRASHPHGLSFRLEAWDIRDPVPMDPAIVEAVEAAISGAGFKPHRTVSGAGHDAMIMAARVPSGMIFVPSIGGISHSPLERTAWEDAALGAEVLLRTVLLLDAGGPLAAHPLSAG